MSHAPENIHFRPSPCMHKKYAGKLRNMANINGNGYIQWFAASLKNTRLDSAQEVVNYCTYILLPFCVS